MSETSQKFSRREFLKGIGALVTGSVLSGCKIPTVTPAEKTPTVSSTEVSTPVPEKKEPILETPVNLTSVSIPVGENREITTFAMAIDTNLLGIKPKDIDMLTVECSEPNLLPKGVFYMDSEQILDQMNKGIIDPLKSKKVDDETVFPTGIIYYPFVEENLSEYEEILKRLGIETISPRNELTGDKPSIPRDFYQNTTFKVTIETSDSTKTYDIGPYYRK